MDIKVRFSAIELQVDCMGAIDYARCNYATKKEKKKNKNVSVAPKTHFAAIVSFHRLPNKM